MEPELDPLPLEPAPAPMRTKVLIVPSPVYLAAATAGSALAAATTAGSAFAAAASPMGVLGSAPTAGAQAASPLALSPAESRRQLYASRRNGLLQLVLEVLATSPVAAAVADESSVQLLEGIGAVVIDADLVDWRHLEGSGRALVFENVYIPLVHPEPAGAAAAQSPWHLETVNVAAPHSRGFDGSGQLVGVLDTGIDATHREFVGKTIHFAEFDGNGNQLPGSARDAGDHGTHVCGLIAGSSVGMAPAADLAVAAVLTTPDAHGRLGGTLVQIAAGLNWLVTQTFRDGNPGVDLINASLGVPGYRNYLYSTLANHGVPMVAAIGNNGRFGRDFHGSPGNYDIVIGVGATDAHDGIAPFSDWGTVSQHAGLSKPDLVAPGVDVYSCLPGGGYGPMNGTSMASPIVAGACALFLQQNPALTFGPLRRAIMSAVRPLPSARAGAGRLQL